MLEHVNCETAHDPYVRWLGHRKNSGLVWGGATWWLPYHGCLVPASLNPQPIRLTESEAAKLLHVSGALMLRHFSMISNVPTGFWYLVCDRYDFDGLSRNTRSKIRRAHKNCVVQKVDPAWLAKEGYPFYFSAYARYSAARPDCEKTFQRKLLDAVGGPFDFWGVFSDSKLVGFAK